MVSIEVPKTTIQVSLSLDTELLRELESKRGVELFMMNKLLNRCMGTLVFAPPAPKQNTPVQPCCTNSPPMDTKPKPSVPQKPQKRTPSCDISRANQNSRQNYHRKFRKRAPMLECSATERNMKRARIANALVIANQEYPERFASQAATACDLSGPIEHKQPPEVSTNEVHARMKSEDLTEQDLNVFKQEPENNNLQPPSIKNEILSDAGFPEFDPSWLLNSILDSESTMTALEDDNFPSPLPGFSGPSTDIENPQVSTTAGEHSNARSNFDLQTSPDVQTEDGKKPIQCHLCSYSASTVSHINSHMWNYHNNIRPFKCPMCDFACKTRSNIAQHFKFRHQMPIDEARALSKQVQPNQQAPVVAGGRTSNGPGRPKKSSVASAETSSRLNSP